MEPKIIRKLGFFEIISLNGFAMGSQATKLAKIKTDIQLNDKYDIFMKAVTAWRQLHPFLNCKVYGDESIRDKNTGFPELFFAESTEAESDVNYLSLNDIGDDKDIHRGLLCLLCQKEVEDEINVKQDLLWRLKLVSLNETEFYVILTIHHAITDGRNTFTILLQLLEIFENMCCNNELKEYKKYDVLPDSLSFFPKNNDLPPIVFPQRVPYPDFPNDPTIKLNYEKYEQFKDKAFTYQGSDKQITISELIEFNKTSKNYK
jgi:hypothetical protein